MRDDLIVSEKRLIAALDRLDHFIDRAALARAPVPAADPGAGAAPGDPAGIEHALHAAQTENQRLSNELVLLHERQQALVAAGEVKLAAVNDRLLAAGQEAARLAAANEALSEANRALIAAAGLPADEARLALEAEIESLRAAREAEIAQMGDLLAVLDEMIATPAPEPAEAAPVKAAPAPAPPARAAVLEMPMPEQVREFADALQDGAAQDGGAGNGEAAAGPAEERG